ncbi:hypothetical protein BI084_gp03 [Gordonia phage Terapin]|uniref:Uncharacterized protein n=5 Tax=Terapinvirus terapin TaxID=2734283 RepID=A0A345MB43_9CAUD|nr:hypothetical protein BI084_gp03 [Gordonia phage Terapin]AVP43280.1 hypothetical protein PBI_DJOKOVIC_3 [Gordonia phage Djokovic]AXH67714.1 hypothetical protein SEA_BEYONCAGE_3 [Gordonia phage Beyoncage]QOC56148.1 hypothetical protein SEA_SIENNA_3 [Gordonia phage Sienna]QOC56573.1 hypothetical protein SEA_BITESIZE_3 [Gordonia phage BiteSize]QYW00806.1 hypothetical protein SEA_MADI_3 [Gordonia phage Madi]
MDGGYNTSGDVVPSGNRREMIRKSAEAARQRRTDRAQRASAKAQESLAKAQKRALKNGAPGRKVR